MSNTDISTKETLASELRLLKDKYSKLERAYNPLKDEASKNFKNGFWQI